MYKRGDQGKSKCPDGYDSIKDISTCEDATKSLNLQYSKVGEDIGERSVCYWCGGCDPPKVSVSSNYANQARWVCKRKGYIKQLFLLSSKQ